MREREFGSQKLPELADGSAIYGEGIYGPSPRDIKFANQVHQELVRERRRVRYQRVDSPGNLQETSPWPLVGKLPRPWRDLVIGGTAAVAGLAAAACSGGGPKPKPEQPPETADNVPKVQAPKDKPEPELPSNPRRVFDQPFAKNPQMSLQKAWKSDFDPNHQGMDYIKGNIDQSATWQSFPVLAAADGDACANPPDRQGNAVIISHQVEQKIMRTYYGHLETIVSEIPECSISRTKPVKRGEKIGEAGATGVKDDEEVEQPRWVHLHFQVNGPDGKIDPYDLRKTREEYPDPNFTNGKTCGPEFLWITCPAVLGARTTAPTPTATPRAPVTPLQAPLVCNPEVVEKQGYFCSPERAIEVHLKMPRGIPFDEKCIPPEDYACGAWIATKENSRLYQVSAPSDAVALLSVENSKNGWRIILPTPRQLSPEKLPACFPTFLWPKPFRAPLVRYAGAQDTRTNVKFGVNSVDVLKEGGFRFYMFFENDSGVTVPWTSDVGDPNIYVVDDRGRKYVSAQVGGRFAQDFAQGMPAGQQWFGWHEFPVAAGARTLTLFYPHRKSIIVDLTKTPILPGVCFQDES